MSNTPSSSKDLFAEVLKNKGITAPASNPEIKAEIKTETKAEAKEQIQDQEPPLAPEEASEDSGKPTELDMLKNRARLMGIAFSNNIGADVLRARIKAKLDGEPDQPEQQQEEDNHKKELDPEIEQKDREPFSATETKPKPKAKSLRQMMFEREMKLVRLRITNLDPRKKDLPGEIFTFANEILGSVKKYIPYGEATENGYHVPHCIYKQLRDREFVNIRTRKGKNGTPIVETGMAREFALEVLPPLTPKELTQLAAAQAAKGGLD